MKLTTYLYLITGKLVHLRPPCVNMSGCLQSPSFIQGERTLCPLNIKVGGPQGQPEHFGEEKILLLLIFFFYTNLTKCMYAQ